MKKFRFKLQTVLDQRQAKEDRLQSELGDIKREEAAEVGRLLCLKDQFHEACDSVEEALDTKASPDEVARRDEYARAKSDDIKVQELTIEGVRVKVAAKRAEVVEAMQDRQVLESLRDRQERNHVLAQASAEQKLLDEMASVRYARSR